jgi:hypothetical protein
MLMWSKFSLHLPMQCKSDEFGNEEAAPMNLAPGRQSLCLDSIHLVRLDQYTVDGDAR